MLNWLVLAFWCVSFRSNADRVDRFVFDDNHVVLRISFGLHRVDQFGLIFELNLKGVHVVHSA